MPPPGFTSDIHEERVLVVAPHCDDEVLGCGGLLAERAAAGARVVVLFLTGDPSRRAEAAAAGEVLGISAHRHADLPDGRLAERVPEVAEAIRAALDAERPELVLVPSPLESSADHRAAFTGLHTVLAATRGSVSGALVDPTILAYEVNRPGDPDILVDVSSQVETLRRAMGCYAGQQARHDYLRAGLGLRRFRTLTLAPTVDAAEGYRRLQVESFQRRSLGELILDMGGLPGGREVTDGPLISVVVRTRERPDRLREALASIASSLHRRVEVVLVNDGGDPPVPPEGFPFAVRQVDLPSRRGRGGAAQAGLEAATGDWVCFLDDDDLMRPEHLSTLRTLTQAADVRAGYTDACVARYALDPDAGWRCVERSLPYSRDFDPDLLLIDNYIPFNTVILERALLVEAGGFDESLDTFEDWDCLIRCSQLARFHHLPRVTAEYRMFDGQPQAFGRRPDRTAGFTEAKSRVLKKHAGSITPDVLSRAVIALRSEAIEASRREADRIGALQAELTRARAELATAVPAERPNAASLPAPLPAYSDEAELRRVVADQADHLRRTYSEIERLSALLTRDEETGAARPSPGRD